jgi:hypothetical protein
MRSPPLRSGVVLPSAASDPPVVAPLVGRKRLDRDEPDHGGELYIRPVELETLPN